jgi:hypothetical protein
MNTTSDRSWRCTLPGCRGCGAGYGSDHQAADAFRRHLERAHRQLLITGGVR